MSIRSLFLLSVVVALAACSDSDTTTSPAADATVITAVDQPPVEPPASPASELKRELDALPAYDPPGTERVEFANADFEMPLADSPEWAQIQHAGERSYEMVLDQETSARGEQSFRIRRTRPQYYGQLSQKVDISELRGKQITVSAAVQSEAVGEQGMLVELFIKSGTGRILSRTVLESVVGTNPWHRAEETIVVPAEARDGIFSVLLLDAGTGWVDDLQVHVLSD